MWKCPVCMTVNTNQQCKECGFDTTTDYEQYPTFTEVSGSAISAQRQLYANSKRSFLKCDNCASLSFRFDSELFELQCLQCGKIHAIHLPVPVAKEPLLRQKKLPATNLSSAKLRFDGVYQCPRKDHTAYLRFFRDGVVVSVGSTGTASDVIRWLDHSYTTSGSYRLNGDKISFSTTSSYGRVDYNGTVLDEGLKITWYSHINGNRSTEDYSFVRV